MILVERFKFYTLDDLDNHFRWLPPSDPNSDLPDTTHLDHENKVFLAANVDNCDNPPLKRICLRHWQGFSKFFFIYMIVSY